MRLFLAPSPRGGRHRQEQGPGGRPAISIHAPREGGDKGRGLQGGVLPGISIHAPREGGDGHADGALAQAGHFNPRPPRGGRQRAAWDAPHVAEFQSTPPARGATCAPLRPSEAKRDFNPRPPRGGRRVNIPPLRRRGAAFQSAPPARGATPGSPCPPCSAAISIHAPREGGDSKDAQFYL